MTTWKGRASAYLGTRISHPEATPLFHRERHKSATKRSVNYRPQKRCNGEPRLAVTSCQYVTAVRVHDQFALPHLSSRVSGCRSGAVKVIFGADGQHWAGDALKIIPGRCPGRLHIDQQAVSPFSYGKYMAEDSSHARLLLRTGRIDYVRLSGEKPLRQCVGKKALSASQKAKSDCRSAFTRLLAIGPTAALWFGFLSGEKAAGTKRTKAVQRSGWRSANWSAEGRQQSHRTQRRCPGSAGREGSRRRLPAFQGWRWREVSYEDSRTLMAR
jgi:hypothetical protein